MEVTKNSADQISLEKAVELTHSYQENNADLPKSYFIGTNKLNELLSQNGCIGVRIYPGLDKATNKVNLVLVGVDQEAEDLTNGVIVDHLVICPPLCPKDSKLNK
ncbi:hypothetical protein [Myroides sp. C4067]|uniref:hypothetical protein n=1 Tax=Myroides sp. C4067 TaxID=3136765 RepID=UPI003100F8C6